MIDDTIEPLDASELPWMMTTCRWMKDYPTIRSLAAAIERDEVTLRMYLDKYSDYLSRLQVVRDFAFFDAVEDYAGLSNIEQRILRRHLELFNRDLTMIENQLGADIDTYLDALTADLEFDVNAWMSRPRSTIIGRDDDDDDE